MYGHELEDVLLLPEFTLIEQNEIKKQENSIKDIFKSNSNKVIKSSIEASSVNIEKYYSKLL